MSDHDDEIIGEDTEGYYVPTRILNEVKEDGKTKYLIEWEDYPFGAATIEPKANFEDNPDLLSAWEREKRRRRLGKAPKFDIALWREAEREWNLKSISEQDRIQAELKRKRESAEAIGNYGDASPSGGTSEDDEADEGPIQISDDSTSPPKRRQSNFKNRPAPDSSEDDDSDEEDLVVAPNRARIPLRRPARATNDNIGVTGYQGNANRAPLPPRREPGDTTQKKPARAAESKNKSKRDGERKPQKLQDKIAAAAAGRPVNNGSMTTFPNMSTIHRFQKAGKGMADRSLAIPGNLRAATDGKRVTFGNQPPLPHSTTKPAASAPAPSPQNNRTSRSRSSDDDAWNVDDDDAPHRPAKSISTADWPRVKQPPQPGVREVLEKREEVLKKQISDAKLAIENAPRVADGPYTEAVVFTARQTSSAGSPASSLLPAPSSHGVLSPANPLGTIADGTATFNPDQARSRPQTHRQRADALFVQPTRERIANRDRVPRPVLQSPAITQAASPPANFARPDARTALRAANHSRGSNQAPESDPAVYQAVTAEMLGCQYSDLLPYLTNPKQVNETAYYYLLFPAISAPFADNITKWLRKCSSRAKVFHCQQPGSWTRFVELTSLKGDRVNGGCLIVHRSLKGLVPKQPLLTAFLRNGENGVWCADETAPNGKIMGNVFRLGGAILLTPKFFETQPQKAFHILDWFYSKKLSHSRGKIWKLALLHGMTSYLEHLWQRSARLREELIQQYKQAGESEQYISRILEFRALSKKDIESMHQNLRHVQKIKHYEVRADAIPGTKEAETCFLELSAGVKYDNDELVYEGFSTYALFHWQAIRKWIFIGTGVSQNKDAPKMEVQANGNSDVSTKEQSSHDAASKGQSLQSLAESLASGAAKPITTHDDLDRFGFIVDTGVEPDVADEYFKKAHGDLALALRLHEIDLRDGAFIQSQSSKIQPSPHGPDNDGDTAMEDASTSLESGEVDESASMNGTTLMSGAAAPSPSRTSSPSRLRAEIQAAENIMEDTVSMVPDTAPPPPPEIMPPPPPAKIRFNLPSPNATRKSAAGLTSPQTQTQGLDARKQTDVDMIEQGEVENKPTKIEDRPTMEWYHDRKNANTDYKHIYVLNFDSAVKFFNIPPVQKHQH